MSVRAEPTGFYPLFEGGDNKMYSVNDVFNSCSFSPGHLPSRILLLGVRREVVAVELPATGCGSACDTDGRGGRRAVVFLLGIREWGCGTGWSWRHLSPASGVRPHAAPFLAPSTRYPPSSCLHCFPSLLAPFWLSDFHFKNFDKDKIIFLFNTCTSQASFILPNYYKIKLSLLLLSYWSDEHFCIYHKTSHNALPPHPPQLTFCHLTCILPQSPTPQVSGVIDPGSPLSSLTFLSSPVLYKCFSFYFLPALLAHFHSIFSLNLSS